MNKKLSFTDFCGCAPSFENMDCDPVLASNNFPDNDDEKVNDDL